MSDIALLEPERCVGSVDAQPTDYAAGARQGSADADHLELAGIRGDPHPARGRRPVRAPGPAVLRRQGFAGAAAARREGVSALGAFRFPLLHIDTGHNFPEVIAFRDYRATRAGRAPDRALGRGFDRPGPRRACAIRPKAAIAINR